MKHNEIDLLRPAAVFAAVVEHGSFRSAAAQLDLSPPFVSQLVTELEDRLGVQLLYRSTRKLELTDAGRRFLDGVSAMLDAFDQGAQAVRHQKSGASGRLRISAPTIMATEALARFLVQFQTARPALELSVDLSDDHRDAIDDRVDLVIRIGNPEDDSRPARRLFQTEGWICAGPQIAPDLRKPEDLKRFRWVRTERMKAERMGFTDSRTGTRVTLEGAPAMSVNSDQLTRHLIALGAGYAVFPDFAVRDAVSKGSLIRVLPELEMPSIGVYALFSARRSRLSNARVFVDALEAFLKTPVRHRT
ncbi:LysR family transcriptional regulator [Lutimaribacter marinistellae]|uniref:LysR family transcriptional regulator n=1 Tax=Lutimaribacter marinistellae TaxID=1820329 RepID=A0ABV7TD85_9RHOB